MFGTVLILVLVEIGLGEINDSGAYRPIRGES